MKKIKKYVYPLAFSAAFIILYTILAHILDIVLETGNYAGAADMVLFTLAWILFFMPVYCVKYSKLLINEKFKFLFAAYNGLVLLIVHLLPFNLRGQGCIGMIICLTFFLWVAFWNLLPVTLRVLSAKKREE